MERRRFIELTGKTTALFAASGMLFSCKGNSTTYDKARLKELSLLAYAGQPGTGVR